MSERTITIPLEEYEEYKKEIHNLKSEVIKLKTIKNAEINYILPDAQIFIINDPNPMSRDLNIGITYQSMNGKQLFKFKIEQKNRPKFLGDTKKEIQEYFKLFVNELSKHLAENMLKNEQFLTTFHNFKKQIEYYGKSNSNINK